MKKKIVMLVLLGNMVIFLLFAFAHWNINPIYWVAEMREFCAFLMGVITFVAFVYFIIELSNKE